MAKNKLELQPTVTLFKWLEALFQANNTMVKMAQSIEKLAEESEGKIPQSYLTDNYNLINTRIGFNNKYIERIEKTIKQKMKETMPSAFVFSDIDQFNQKINLDINKFLDVEKKGLKKPLKKA